VIATSRSRLFGLPTDLDVDLDVFSPDEALALLERLIGQDRLARERPAALELVATCGFLPLAVRIVAARLASRRSWTIEALTARLTDERRRIAELRVGDLTVEAAFELSYRQLTLAQARAFRLVSLADGPDIGLQAARALLEVTEAEAEDQLEALVDAAMLESPAPGRYRYHDLVRVFARQCAESGGGDEAAGAFGRWLDFLLATACSAFQQAVPGDPVSGTLGPARSPGLVFADLAAAKLWVAAEFDGIVAAAEQAIARDGASAGPGGATELLRAAVDLLIAVSPFGRDVRYGSLARAALAAAASAERSGDRWALGRARFLSGNAALQATRLTEAETQSRLAVAASREAGDEVILRQALNDLGLVAQFLSRHDEAVACYDEAILLARRLDHRSGEVATILNAALARVRSGRAAGAVSACEGVLATLSRGDGCDGPGGGTARSYALYVLGLALHQVGRFEEAIARYGECVALCRAVGLREREAHACHRLADSLRMVGRLEEAAESAESALLLCRETRSERDEGHALVALGRALTELGRGAEARDRFEQALAVYDRLGLPEALEVTALLEVPDPVLTDGR
jgi:tetratricopeptide (TPR) repeat protein